MKRLLLPLCLSLVLYSCFVNKKNSGSKDNDENENPMARNLLEIRKIQDPALGYVPAERFIAAYRHTEQLRNEGLANRNYLPLVWEARGPVYDSVGPSNGNGRGGSGSVANKNLGGYTSGRIRAFLLDTLNDPTGNTAFTGGVAGGLWRCTNFLSSEPNWMTVDEEFTNLAVSSIAQDPTNRQIIYVATGEPTYNSDAVYGNGVYKSNDGGITFQPLPNAANFLKIFKIGCDAAGNVYLAGSARGGASPVPQRWGLFRSNNRGVDWTDISPTGLTSNAKICSDFEITASGILNASFGYSTNTSSVRQRYTATPATVTPDTWSTGAGFRTTTGAYRMEMAVAGEVLYAVTINSSFRVDSCYKSVDGGANWTKQNTAAPSSSLGSQGWYDLTLAINPSNTDEVTVGVVDAYKSTNAGNTWSRLTYWVSTSPYVHADQHFHQYWIKDGETRIIMATDGGIFYSADNGATFVNKNKNLNIKQFYAGAIHPDAGSNYMLAGAQDNGSHQFKNPGLSYTTEVTGGDGAFVHINQVNPDIQFTSYVYNQYRRSTNGGASWSSINISSSQGEFINPFDHDDVNNIMYASQGNRSEIRRWTNTHNSTASSVIKFASSTLGGTGVSLVSFKVSPYTSKRLFFGTDNGRLFRLDNADTVTAATIDAASVNIGSTGFSTGGYISCVNTGTTDDNLVAVFSNYGINNVWVTTDGGTTWSAIDGDLPDMPVRWALFEPGDNNKLYIATEAGIYTTTNINGASTNWLPEPGFPPVRTDMIKMRNSDSTIIAATHGRGVYTAKIPPCAPNAISDQPDNTTICAGADATFTVATSGPQVLYQWQVSTDGGATFTDITGATNATLTVSAATITMNGYKYRCITDTYCSGKLASAAATLTVSNSTPVTMQPANTTVCAGGVASFTVAGQNATAYQWQLWNGNTWNNIAGATAATLTINNVTQAMNSSSYRAIVTGLCGPGISDIAVLTVKPPSNIIINASPSPVLLPGQSTTLTAVANPSGGSYVWLLNGQPTGVTGATLPNITVDGIGTYTVRYTGANGCVTTSAPLEVTAQQSDFFWVYPNPNNGQFQVRVYSTTNTPFTLNVFDAKGAKVYSKTTTPTQAYTTIPVDLGKTTPMGVYVVELRDNTGKRLGSKQISVNL